MIRRLAVITAIILVAVVGLASCGQKYDDQHGVGDAPVLNKRGDDAAAVVINFPDQFANVAIKCFHGTGLYVTTRDAAPVIIKDDPNCDGNVVVLVEKPG